MAGGQAALQSTGLRASTRRRRQMLGRRTVLDAGASLWARFGAPGAPGTRRGLVDALFVDEREIPLVLLVHASRDAH